MMYYNLNVHFQGQRVKVLTAVVEKTQVIWYMTPSRLVLLSNKTKSISGLVITKHGVISKEN